MLYGTISFNVKCSKTWVSHDRIRHRVKRLDYRYYRFCARFFTSSSLTGCNMSLFGCPGVLPECPFDQSYDTAYAKIDPFRLNADEETGPGRGSNAIKTVIKKKEYKTKLGQREVLFRRVRESLSQKLIVPSDPVVWQCSKELNKRAKSTSYRTWRMYHVWDGN